MNPSIEGLACLWMAWIINAAWPIWGRIGVSRMSTTLFLEISLWISFAFLLPALLREGRFRSILSREYRSRLFTMAALSSGLASLLYIGALVYTTPADAAIVAQLEILYSALLSRWMLREKITPPQMAASALILSGTLLIMGNGFQSGHWKGDLMIALSPWLYQLSHVMVKRLPSGLDALSLAGARSFYAALFLMPFAAFTLMTGGAVFPRASSTAWILIVQGVVISALNMVFWYGAIRRMDLSKATAILLSYPAATLLLSWRLGFESIGPAKIAGLVLAVAGASWLSRLTAPAGAQPQTRPREAAAAGSPTQ